MFVKNARERGKYNTTRTLLAHEVKGQPLAGSFEVSCFGMHCQPRLPGARLGRLKLVRMRGRTHSQRGEQAAHAWELVPLGSASASFSGGPHGCGVFTRAIESTKRIPGLGAEENSAGQRSVALPKGHKVRRTGRRVGNSPLEKSILAARLKKLAGKA